MGVVVALDLPACGRTMLQPEPLQIATEPVHSPSVVLEVYLLTHEHVRLFHLALDADGGVATDHLPLSLAQLAGAAEVVDHLDHQVRPATLPFAIEHAGHVHPLAVGYGAAAQLGLARHKATSRLGIACQVASYRQVRASTV